MRRKDYTTPGGRLFRWLIAKLPEAELFDSLEERNKAISELAGAAPVWRGYFCVIVIGIFLLPLGRFVDRRWIWVVVPALGTTISTFWQRRSAAMFLRRRLLVRGIPVCIKCGYCLRGIESDKCPECGREIEADIRRMIEDDAKRQNAVNNSTSE